MAPAWLPYQSVGCMGMYIHTLIKRCAEFDEHTQGQKKVRSILICITLHRGELQQIAEDADKECRQDHLACTYALFHAQAYSTQLWPACLHT